MYCMSRIENTAESTVIEHWCPLSKSKEKALQYENLFASCYGGQKETVNGVHRIRCCDAKKQDASIKVDPRNERMMEILYTIRMDGSISRKAMQPLKSGICFVETCGIILD